LPGFWNGTDFVGLVRRLERETPPEKSLEIWPYLGYGWLWRGNGMKKSTTVRAMIDPEKKQKAGEILARLGMNHSEAINIFYSLIIENNGLPFPVRLREEDGDKSARLDPEILSHLKKSVRVNLYLGKRLA